MVNYRFWLGLWVGLASASVASASPGEGASVARMSSAEPGTAGSRAGKPSLALDRGVPGSRREPKRKFYLQLIFTYKLLVNFCHARLGD